MMRSLSETNKSQIPNYELTKLYLISLVLQSNKVTLFSIPPYAIRLRHYEAQSTAPSVSIVLKIEHPTINCPLKRSYQIINLRSQLPVAMKRPNGTTHETTAV
jgi:hypothetical protein